MAIHVQSDIRSAILFATAFHHHRHNHRPSLSCSLIFRQLSLPYRSLFVGTVRSFSSQTEKRSSSTSADEKKLPTKPSICTADELHYVTAKNSKWRLALWRYIPPPQAPKRNHPLLLLSGVGTNAIGYDLAPGSSFARYMCAQGFDTWILEVRGAGLSTEEMDSKDIEKSAQAISDEMEAAVENATDGIEAGEENATDGVLSRVHEQSNDGQSSLAKFEVALVNGDSIGITSDEVSTDEEQHSPVPDQSTDGQESFAESEIAMANKNSEGNASAWDESKLVSKLTDTSMSLSERLSGFLNESQSNIMSTKLFDQLSKLFEDSFLYERFNEVKGKLLSLLETRQNSSVTSQIRELSQKLVNIVEEGQRSVSPQLYDMQERLTSTVEDFQKQLELIIKYDWDFDHYLEEDIPAAMEYIRSQCGSKDGKLVAIGHSMGGILLYAMLSRCGAEGRESPFAAIVTLASSLDYTSSKSTLKLLLPLADPAQVLNVPVVPLGALLSAAYPLSSSPPYVLSWLVDHISAQDMMHPELLKKLVLNNFCTIPAKLLLQLTTAFREGGLRDRSGKFLYKDHIHKSNVPVLALAGDRDLICPPEAVYETVKLLPEALVTYKLFGKDDGPHYAHYDLVGGRMAVEEVYPCIVQFLSRYDQV